MNNKIYNVTNRSNIQVGYTIPELNNLRRDFTPGETKKIGYEELEKLSYIPGGMYILSEYLMVQDIEVLDKLNMKPEREYHLSHEEVVKLLKTGSMDEFLDCLDFAPKGVIDLLKVISVNIELNDMKKREIIQKKTGFNVNNAIKIKKEGNEVIEEENAAPTRRVTVNTEATNEAPVRRTVTLKK